MTLQLRTEHIPVRKNQKIKLKKLAHGRKALLCPKYVKTSFARKVLSKFDVFQMLNLTTFTIIITKPDRIVLQMETNNAHTVR